MLFQNLKLSQWWFLVCLLTLQVGAAINVGQLRCEQLNNPLGMDTVRPQLNWIINSDRRNEGQTAYQSLVASTRELLAADQGDLWDSGKVVAEATTRAEYAGTRLRSREQCLWKVRIGDRAGQPADLSEGVTFLRSEPGAAVYHVGSGAYQFTSTLGSK